MNGYIEILRPANGVMAAVAVAVGFFVTAGSAALSAGLVFAMASAFLILSGGMVINDYFDLPIDKKKKKHRPIPSGRVGKQAAVAYSAVLYAAGIGLAAIINAEALLIALVAAVTLFLYAWKMSQLGFTGNFVVAFNTALTFVFGSAAAGGPIVSVQVLSLAGMALFATLAREIYLDLRDIKEDKGVRKTLPMRIGARKSVLVAAFALVAAIMLSPVPYVAGAFGGTYLFLVALADVGFLYIAVNGLRRPHYAREAHFCKVFQIAALVAFLVGAL